MHNFDSLKNHINSFEDKIKVYFNDKSHLLLALTHSSYANENKNEKLESNERLEFLGDAVLNVSITEKIYKNREDLAEGEMTKVRASIVCEASLLKCAHNISLGEYLLLGKGEELTGGRSRVSILSDAFEAVIGAIYLDKGLEGAKIFIYKQMKENIDNSIKGALFQDYKTQLQELVQRKGEARINYEIIEEKGPDHDKKFVSQVTINDVSEGTGEGRSKKEAEQNAAKSALERLLT